MAWELATLDVPNLAAGARLTFGRRPNASTYAALAAARLDIWWNLARELADIEAQMLEVSKEVLSARIADFATPDDVPRFEAQLERVCAVLARGGRVHVSCYGGRGRTGLALACIRVRLGGEPPDVALARVRPLCGGPETEAQATFVRSFRAARTP